MRSLDRPGPRPPAVPRFLLEIVFLIAVAGAAAIAELDPAIIVALMAGAWALVAAAEWFAARAAQRQAVMSEMPLAGAGGVFPDDPSWFAPPLERGPVVAEPARQDFEHVEEHERADEAEDTAGSEESAPPPRLPPRAED
jgi:hypothetical protein